MAALHSDHLRQVPLVGAGCFREVAALHSDHLRQVPLYNLTIGTDHVCVLSLPVQKSSLLTTSWLALLIT